MKQRASGSRRLPASAWVFDGVLALVAAGWATALFVPMPSGGRPRGMLALGDGVGFLHTFPFGGGGRGAAAVPGAGSGPCCGRRTGGCRPWPAAVLRRAGHPGGGLLGGRLRRPVGL